MIYFMELFIDLSKESDVNRPDILYIIDIYNDIKNNDKFNNVIKLLKDHLSKDKN